LESQPTLRILGIYEDRAMTWEEIRGLECGLGKSCRVRINLITPIPIGDRYILKSEHPQMKKKLAIA
jgi:hypothetical protein